MTSDSHRPRRNDRSDARAGRANGEASLAAAQPTHLSCEGSSIGGVPAGLLQQLSLVSSAPSPADALTSVDFRGDPLYRRLSVVNQRLAARLQGLEVELADLRRALNRAASDASTDPLTGLANRRAFDDALRVAAAGACEAAPGQLLIADIDHFKALNDAHGHHFGDTVLCITGEVLKAAVRRDTVVARLGGDEFALLLAGPTTAQPVRVETAAIARRLCARIAQRPLTVRGHPERRERVTLSIGLAGWRPGESPADWYERADAALYTAKRSGRNQVVVADTSNGGQATMSMPQHSREGPR